MDRGADETPPPPLSWRTWLLVPLVALALVGVVVPIQAVHFPDSGATDSVPRRTPDPRQPYNDELERLLTDQTVRLTLQDIEALGRLHEECKRERQHPSDRIPAALRRRVDAQLAKFGRSPK